MSQVTKRVAVISGGSSGIGKEIARTYAENGIHVVLLARGEERLRNAAMEIREHGGDADIVVASVTDVFSIQEALKGIYDRLGRIDVLVNSAGGGPVGGIMQITDQEWDENLALKQMGAVRLTREALPYLKRSDSGNILNIIGVFGKQPHPDFIIGSMTNAALLAFTKALSDEVAKDGIRVNAINPGPTDTPLWDETLRQIAEKLGGTHEDINREMAKLSPFGRITLPSDVAKAALFLISDEASFITGISLNVDGGVFRGIA